MREAGLWKGKRSPQKYRAMRQRRSALGMLVQLDGSEHDWLEGRGPLAKRPMKMSVLRQQLRLHVEAADSKGAEELVERLLAAANEAVAGFLSLPAARATAPSRRYADLVTQRRLKAALAGRPAPYSAEELQELAAWCSRREEEASRVEAELARA